MLVTVRFKEWMIIRRFPFIVILVFFLAEPAWCGSPWDIVKSSSSRGSTKEATSQGFGAKISGARPSLLQGIKTPYLNSLEKRLNKATNFSRSFENRKPSSLKEAKKRENFDDYWSPLDSIVKEKKGSKKKASKVDFSEPAVTMGAPLYNGKGQIIGSTKILENNNGNYKVLHYDRKGKPEYVIFSKKGIRVFDRYRLKGDILGSEVYDGTFIKMRGKHNGKTGYRSLDANGKPTRGRVFIFDVDY